MALSVGRFASRTCSGMSRRSFLQLGATLPFLPAAVAEASGRVSAAKDRAKSVIFVWLWGAPSHIDLFDPKPDAPLEVRGPFAPIATRTPGMNFSELLPKLADRSHLFTTVRSNVTFAPGHPDAGTFGLTGYAEKPGPVRPSFGSIVAKHRGYGGGLPPYVALGQGIPRDVVRIVDGYGGGTLGRGYDPFLVSCSETGGAELPSLKLLDGLTPHRVNDRRALLSTIDSARRTIEDGRLNDWGRMYDRAYDLLTIPGAGAAFDLTRESSKTRETYGQTAFGQSCLMARRLVEAHVPFIQVNWSEYVEPMTPNCDFGWDTHIYNFELLPDRHCPIFDRAMAALFDDLHDRGLLETTLVVAIGEFGRSPRITDRASRDHWPRCYSSLWAGAGITGGRVIGQSDRLAQDPVTTPITPLMVGTTIAELTGMDTQARVEMGVLTGGSAVDEILA